MPNLWPGGAHTRWTAAAAHAGPDVWPMEAPPNSAWARRSELAGDLVVATSPDLAAHHNMRASAEWDASSPCADDMQTDSPSNMKTPVPEGRHGMEVRTPLAGDWARLSPRFAHRALCGALGTVCVTAVCGRADGQLADAHATGPAISVEETAPRFRGGSALRR